MAILTVQPLFQSVRVYANDYKLLHFMFGKPHEVDDNDTKVIDDCPSEGELGEVLTRLKAFDDLHGQVKKMRKTIDETVRKSGRRKGRVEVELYIDLNPSTASALLDQITTYKVVTGTTTEVPLETRVRSFGYVGQLDKMRVG